MRPISSVSLTVVVGTRQKDRPRQNPNPLLIWQPTMSHTVSIYSSGLLTPSCGGGAAKQRKSSSSPKSKNQQAAKQNVGFGGGRKEVSWKCVQGCGACCKLAKGPSFATPEEIFLDPKDIEAYTSLIGDDGWCIHFDKPTRTCSIYSERPYFCQVEPDVFRTLYGIEEKRFNKEACSCCRDTIKAVYGPHSKELDNFNKNLKNPRSS